MITEIRRDHRYLNYYEHIYFSCINDTFQIRDKELKNEREIDKERTQ